MRHQASGVFELTKGFSTEPKDNALATALEMAGYVLELTARPQPIISKEEIVKKFTDQVMSHNIDMDFINVVNENFWDLLKDEPHPQPSVDNTSTVEPISGVNASQGERTAGEWAGLPGAEAIKTTISEDKIEELWYNHSGHERRGEILNLMSKEDFRAAIKELKQ